MFFFKVCLVGVNLICVTLG